MSYKTKVKLIAYTKLNEHTALPDWYDDSLSDVEQLIEYCGRLCYDSQDNTNRVHDWLQRRIRDGHESLIEHSYASFHIWCSRAVSHELVRHRIASYSQRSQRYVAEGKSRFITPPELTGENLKIFNDAMARDWYVYKQLLANGVRSELARYVLPNACETQIVMTMNMRALRNFLMLRTSTRALPEMQEVAGQVKELCQKHWSRVFGDL